MSANNKLTPEKLEAWKALATRQMKGKSPDDLTWHTPEDIPVKPLYTSLDMEGLEHADTLPGMAPYVRGPQATMYAGVPGRSASTRASAPQRSPMPFIARLLPPGGRGSPSLSTWPRTAATTRITSA
jgi:methylmalonyl-CoA mutase